MKTQDILRRATPGLLVLAIATSMVGFAWAAAPSASSTGADRTIGSGDIATDPMGPVQVIKVEAVGSVGLPRGSRPYPPLVPTFPQSFALAPPGDIGTQPYQPIIAAVPASPESVVPGHCSNNPATSCTTNAPCIPGGGTCVFYRSEVYKNEATSVFSSGVAPRTALDDINLSNALPYPPAVITYIEWAMVTDAAGVPAGSTIRVEIRFWDNLVPNGNPVNTGFHGGVNFTIPGPFAANGAFIFTGEVPLALGISPDDPNMAIQFDYRNNATNALAFGTPAFVGSGVQTGTSADIYWRDVNADGTFTDPGESRSFGGPPNLANFYVHLGAELPIAESEPNDTQGGASILVPCHSLNGAITPVADQDWYKFTVSAAQTIVAEVACGNAANDSTLTLRNSLGNQIDFNDDISGANLCSRITANLAAGDYFLEVHEKGDNATIASYSIGVGPPPPVVTNLLIGTLCSPNCTNKHSIVWDPIAGSAPYDIVYGDLQALHNTASISGSFGGCLGDNLASPAADDSDSPAPGEGFYYFARARNACSGGPGTFDEGGNQITTRDTQMPAFPTGCSNP